MNAVIFGGSGGIGKALIHEIKTRFPETVIHATWHSNEPDITGVAWHRVDLSDESQIAAFAQGLGDVHWVINTAGLLHTETRAPEKTIRDFDAGFFSRSMEANTMPSLLIAKHLMDHLRHGKPSVYAVISARVGSITDNRLGGWYSYRCSKAALNMAVKNISIEWARTLPLSCVVALHPGTTDTALSQPFQARVPAGKLFPVEKTAGLLVDRLREATAENTGRFLAYDGSEIPW